MTVPGAVEHGVPAVTPPASMPVAEIDRRFYALVVDRLLGWAVEGVALWLAIHFLFSRGHVVGGVLVLVAAVLAVLMAYAVALGVTGSSPGKAMVGLRVVGFGTGQPIGVGPAMLRQLIVGLATLPTLGIGTATLAWTAVADRGHLRRAWHDHRAGSIVVDVRPAPVVTSDEPQSGPRHVVNLTALRLVPVREQAPPPSVPHRAPRAQRPPAPEVASSPTAQQPTPVAPVPAAPSPVPRPVPEDGRTVVRGRPEPSAPAAAPGWQLSLDTGETVVLTGLALLGRRPEPRAGEQPAHLLALPSTDMSVSKTHAQVTLAPDGALVLTDRGSTNGSVLVRQGLAKPLTAGRPVTLLEGDEVRLGDRVVRVQRPAAG